MFVVVPGRDDGALLCRGRAVGIEGKGVGVEGAGGDGGDGGENSRRGGERGRGSDGEGGYVERELVVVGVIVGIAMLAGGCQDPRLLLALAEICKRIHVQKENK